MNKHVRTLYNVSFIICYIFLAIVLFGFVLNTGNQEKSFGYLGLVVILITVEIFVIYFSFRYLKNIYKYPAFFIVFFFSVVFFGSFVLQDLSDFASDLYLNSRQEHLKSEVSYTTSFRDYYYEGKRIGFWFDITTIKPKDVKVIYNPIFSTINKYQGKNHFFPTDIPFSIVSSSCDTETNCSYLFVPTVIVDVVKNGKQICIEGKDIISKEGYVKIEEWRLSTVGMVVSKEIRSDSSLPIKVSPYDVPEEEIFITPFPVDILQNAVSLPKCEQL